MKAVILAGGLGTRISEETAIKPKPMVDIGEMPILWHIMKIYSSHGVRDFIILCGYKGYVIKDFFSSYLTRTSTVEFDFSDNSMKVLDSNCEDWKVTLVDTGSHTMTGGRIKRAREYIGDQPFYLTYGDGVSDIDLTALRNQHFQSNSIVTLTAVQPPGRFGAISLGANQTTINEFLEKPNGDGAWVNGGYFVVNPEAINYIDSDQDSWEQHPLNKIASEGKLSAFKHNGFWQPMDTLRDKHYLESLWASERPPWKIWSN